MKPSSVGGKNVLRLNASGISSSLNCSGLLRLLNSRPNCVEMSSSKRYLLCPGRCAWSVWPSGTGSAESIAAFHTLTIIGLSGSS